MQEDRECTHCLSGDLKELYRSIIAGLPDGVVLLDSSMKVRLVNPMAAELLRVGASDLLDKTFPFPIEDEQPQEIRVDCDQGKPVHIAIRRSAIQIAAEPLILLAMRDITARVKLREQLRTRSMLDSHTGLYNRRGLITLGEHAIRLCRREKSGLLMVFVDLDGLKEINDRLGHKEGDKAIKEAASLLTGTFRSSDIVARIGGDEFAIVAHNRSPEDIPAIRRRIGANLSKHNSSKGRKFRLSLSLGFSKFDCESPCQLDDLLERADIDMYEQKRKKKSGARSVF